jgi:hypothetical protein
MHNKMITHSREHKRTASKPGGDLPR